MLNMRMTPRGTNQGGGWHFRSRPHSGSHLTITATIFATAFVTANYFGPDLGWTVATFEVKSERKVTIDHDLNVKKDIILGGGGSVVEMTGVDCRGEQRSAKGSGRLCFDSAGFFMISENGGDYRPLGRQGPAGRDGANGKDGAAGRDGAAGKDGLNCWDANGNGRQDSAEDTNRDGRYTARDCITFTVG